MIEKMSGEVMSERITRELDTLSDSEDYFGIMNIRSWTARLAIVCASLRRVVKRSSLRMIGNEVYLFNGKIYERIPENVVLYDAVKNHLRHKCVPEEDIFTRFKSILGEMFGVLRLKPKLNPKYHIQAFSNGVLNMSTLEFTDFSPEYDVIYIHDYDYDPKAKCPMWMAFIRQMLPETASRAILQMYLGLCTFDRGSMRDKVENCLMLYGTGANGKSVIFETINGIFGRDNISNAGLGAMLKDGDERLRTMASIDGKIINVCPEIQAKTFSGNEDAFKSLCSGEPQLARRIKENVYTMYNVPRLIFNMNNVPKSEDSSWGFYRRFLYLVFEVVIPEKDQNKHLADDLKKEYPGILNWIIRGGKQLEKNNYVFPASDNASRIMLKNIADKNITLSWFRARQMRVDPATPRENDAWIRSGDLYDDMVLYADANGFEPCTKVEFGKKMGDIGFTLFRRNKKRSADGVFYQIYGFKPENVGQNIPIIADERLVNDTNALYDESDL